MHYIEPMQSTHRAGFVERRRHRGALLHGALLVAGLAFAGLTGLAAPAAAQPAPVRIIVASPAGDSQDTLGRAIAERMQASLGQPVVVENLPGRAGRNGAEAMAKAPADGLTLLVCAMGMTTIFPYSYAQLAYDPDRDFSYLAHLVKLQFALVVPAQSDVSDMPSYTRFLRRNPNRQVFGSTALGSGPHFYGELIGKSIGMRLKHQAYPSGAALMNDLAAGQLPAAVVALSNAVQPHKQGKVRIVAVSGEQRAAQLPEVPTMRELGYPLLVVESWFGLCGQKGIPFATQRRLSAAAIAAVRTPAMAERMGQLGLVATGLEPIEFKRIVDMDDARWRAVVKWAKFKAED
jgi:tripartite-type tricarboxylate transporter receptor subunit TctC